MTGFFLFRVIFVGRIGSAMPLAATKDTRPVKAPGIAKKGRSATEILRVVGQKEGLTAHFHQEVACKQIIPGELIKIPEEPPPLNVFFQYNCDQFLV
ncbi:hypothetical protein [Chitinophaga ginsengisoli]|uniref:hypothetical protein n=1 Tax=Chitinophaga ginsengisoli TaxID=363837 RepID=UPI0011B1E0AB|nr:hypothetical protein [Chitinophaga ginsengisoli]